MRCGRKKYQWVTGHFTVSCGATTGITPDHLSARNTARGGIVDWRRDLDGDGNTRLVCVAGVIPRLRGQWRENAFRCLGNDAGGDGVKGTADEAAYERNDLGNVYDAVLARLGEQTEADGLIDRYEG